MSFILLGNALVNNLLKLALLGSSWVMYLLILLSIVSLGAMIERWLFFRKNSGDAEAIGEKVVQFIDRNDMAGAEAALAADRSIEAQVTAKALKWAGGGHEAFSHVLRAEYAKQKHFVEKSLIFLGTLGSNAPFIGLFGTVIGVIEAFAHLGSGTDKAAMANVMAGIAEALIATAVGLFVAIPAVVAYNFFQKKLVDLEDNIEEINHAVVAILKALEVNPTAAHKAVREINGEAPPPTDSKARASA